MTTKYCRIINDEIVEWNVLKIHIENRGLKVEDFTPVRSTPRPATLPWEYVVERKPNLVDGVPVRHYEVLKYPIETYKEMRNAEIKKLTMNVLTNRQRLDTSLGFAIDAGYTELVDFQSAKNLGLTFLRDADNNTQTVTQEDWDVIITTIQTMGVQIKKNKWDLQDAIKAIEVGDTYTTEEEALQAIFDVGIGMLKDLNREAPGDLPV